MYSRVKRKSPQSVTIIEKRRQQVLLKEHLKAVTHSEEQLENTRRHIALQHVPFRVAPVRTFANPD